MLHPYALLLKQLPVIPLLCFQQSHNFISVRVVGRKNIVLHLYDTYKPLAHHENAANLEDKTKQIFSSGN